MQKVAVISAILENPTETQHDFNDIVVSYKGLIRGRMGLPLIDEDITIITLTVVGNLNDINSLTGKLGRLEQVQVKTAISKKDIN
jgi:putative iron-only hydrogenase system regulator